MLLNMVIMLTVTSLLLEGLFAFRVVSYRHLMQRAEWLSVVVSMTISYVIGKLFGAAGLICLMAGIGSTVCSPFMYKAMNWWEYNREDMQDSINRGREMTHDLFRIFVVLIKVATFPLWGPRRVINFFSGLSADFKHTEGV